MNVITHVFTGTCLDSFSDIKKVFEVREILNDDVTDRLAIVSFQDAHDDIRIGFFRMQRAEKNKEWKKVSSMTFAVRSIEAASEMIKTPQVLFGAKTE